MAWKTGKHAEAPAGVLCFGADEPGMVTWDDEAAAAAEAPKHEAGKPAHEAAHSGPPHARAETKHG